MTRHLDFGLSLEMREATAGLPLYNGGPGVDYTNASVAYAANITLLHDPDMERDRLTWAHRPSPETSALVAHRGSGDGEVGIWSGISGYIDTFYDPRGLTSGQYFDPVVHTVRQELAEECGMYNDEIDLVELYLGKKFNITRNNGGELRVLPLLGVVLSADRPKINIDDRELTDYRWVPLCEIKKVPQLSRGYLDMALPRALGGLGLDDTRVQKLLDL